MKVSIVIPAHNEEKYLAETIRAALAQEYRDIEVIVVDNASIDRTREIVHQFPVRYVFEERKGILWARERGRIEATGDIIANMDADCLPDPQWVTRGVKHFIRKEVVAVTGPCIFYDAPFVFRWGLFVCQKYIYRPLNAFLQLPFLRRGAILIGGNTFVRADVLKKIKGYNTELIFYGEDTDTAKRVAMHGKVLFQNDVVMKTSARRFKREGFFRVVGIYCYHFLKITFRRKSMA